MDDEITKFDRVNKSNQLKLKDSLKILDFNNGEVKKHKCGTCNQTGKFHCAYCIYTNRYVHQSLLLLNEV